MQHPIEWHKRALANSRSSLEAARARLRTLMENVADQANRVAFLERQIAEAEHRGMTTFDSERLLIPTRKVKQP